MATYFKNMRKLYLADPSVVVDADKLTEIWQNGVVETQNGRALLSTLFASPTFTLIDVLHGLLKNHILTMNQSKISLIGQIYLKAWKAAAVDRRTVLEESCLQDLIRCSLFTKRHVAAFCLEVLRPFVTQRQLKEVDCIVYKLTEPLIWRSLSSGNNTIRYNAISFLLMAFPFRTYLNTPADQSELMDRQLKALHEYLFDDVDEIRVKSVKAVGQILSLYWDIISETHLRKLLGALFNKLAHDKNCVPVRVAVCSGARMMMENPLTHVVLDALLPKLAMRIHDRAESVRSAMVDLLLDTVSLKGLNFWQIVSIKDLVDRLAMEQSVSLRERLVRLLLNSYYPAKADDDVRLGRTVSLFKMNMLAARIFYQHFAKFATVEAAVNQILLLLCCVYGCIRNAQEKISKTSFNSSVSGNGSQLDQSMESNRSENDTAQSQDSDSITVNDAAVMVGFLDCAAILWYSIGQELAKEENEPFRKQLYKKGGSMILKFVQFFDTPPILDSVMVLVGLMTKAAARYLSGSLAKKMMSVDDGGFDPKMHGSLAETMCLVQLTEIVPMVGGWWRNYDSTAALNGDMSSPPPKPKRVRISVPAPQEVSKPRLGFQLISYLLKRPSTRKYLMGHTEQLWQLESDLQGMWEHCMAMPDNCRFDEHWTAEIVKLRATIIGLLCAKDTDGAQVSKFLSSFMDLLRVNVIPIYEAGDQQNESADDVEGGLESKLNRAKAVLEAAFAVWSNFIICGLCDDKILVLATELTKVPNETDRPLIVGMGKLIYHILEYIKFHGVSVQVGVLLHPWFDQVVQFTTSNPDLFDGMKHVNLIIDKFVKVFNQVGD